MIEKLNPWVEGKRVLILGFGREGRSTWKVLRQLGTCACLDLAARLRDGDDLTAQEAARLLPGREQFVRLWQALLRLVGTSGTVTAEALPALRRLAGATGGAEPFLRTAVALGVFAERGLLSLERGEDTLTITIAASGKVDLGDNPGIRRLHRVLGLTERGGV